MKKIIALFFVLGVLFLTACGPGPGSEAVAPDQVTFVYCGHEDNDDIELLNYPETDAGIQMISDSRNKIQVDFAPREKTVVVNGTEYRLEYEGSYHRAREESFTHSYVLKTKDYWVSAKYMETGETLVSLSFLDYTDADPAQIEDLSERGEYFFQSLAGEIIRTYCNADAADYRVHCTTRQEVTTSNGWGNPEYEGFVPEPQFKNSVDCIKHYQFFFVKYANEMPTEEYIRVELRQDGYFELLVSWHPGGMEGYLDYKVSPKAVENAAREFIEAHYKSDIFTLDSCEIKSVTLCLDQEHNPFFSVGAFLTATTKDQDFRHKTYETLYFKPVAESGVEGSGE